MSAEQRDGVACGRCLGEDTRGFALGLIAHRREHADDGYGIDAARADVGADPGDVRGIQRSDERAVEIEAARRLIDVLADRGAQILRPVDHGRQAAIGGQRQTHNRGLGEVAALDDGIGELGRADHDEAHLFGCQGRRLEHLAKRLHEAIHDVGRRRHFHDGAHVRRCSHHDGVDIGTSDIHPNAEHVGYPQLMGTRC